MIPSFSGMRVVAFESRRADDMCSLILEYGGVPLVAPALRERPLEDQQAAIRFVDGMVQGEYDVVILLTGGGTRVLNRIAEERIARSEWQRALSTASLVARGGKPVAALSEFGLRPTHQVPDPCTWHDLIELLDRDCPVAGKRVALQESGATDRNLREALESRGAVVTPIGSYEHALPEDVAPLQRALDEVVSGQVEIALFTSIHQVRHLLNMADANGIARELVEGFRSVAVGSIGPNCSQGLRAAQISVEHEPDQPRMERLVHDMARLGRALLEKKRTSRACGVDTGAWRRIDAVWKMANGEWRMANDEGRTSNDSTVTEDLSALTIVSSPLAAPDSPFAIRHSPFLQACRREPTDYTPIWLMRQAGRYQREYRELRARHSFLEMCTNPQIAAEVTLMAVDRLQVDAAIIFSDLLPMLQPMGVDLEYTKGEGPVIHRPIRTAEQIDRLAELDPESMHFVYEAIALARQALRPDLPLIGFAGLPFTLASYVIEGGGSRNYLHTKRMMYVDPGAWHALMAKLGRAVATYVTRQIASGTQAIQLFDSWVGCVSPDDYRTFVLPHSQYVFSQLSSGNCQPSTVNRPPSGAVPLIHFGTGTASLLELMREAGGDVIGLDWRVDLAEAWERLGEVAVQGNLDPAALFCDRNTIRDYAHRLLDKAAGRPGHIFNLGHGILPGTPEANVMALVDAVHEYRKGPKNLRGPHDAKP